MRVVLREIRHDGEGFAALARLHAQIENCFFDDVEIDMRSTTWFDADMCAAFGAVLYRLGDQLNTIDLTHFAVLKCRTNSVEERFPQPLRPDENA